MVNGTNSAKEWYASWKEKMKNDELCNRKDKIGKKRKVEKNFIVLFYHNAYNHSN